MNSVSRPRKKTPRLFGDLQERIGNSTRIPAASKPVLTLAINVFMCSGTARALARLVRRMESAATDFHVAWERFVRACDQGILQDRFELWLKQRRRRVPKPDPELLDMLNELSRPLLRTLELIDLMLEIEQGRMDLAQQLAERFRHREDLVKTSVHLRVALAKIGEPPPRPWGGITSSWHSLVSGHSAL